MSKRNQRHERHAKAFAPRLVSFSEEDLVYLRRKDARELITELSTDIKRFQRTLENADICKKNLDVIIVVLLKVSSGLGAEDELRLRALNILGETFSNRCTTFQENLKRFVSFDVICGSGKIEENLASVCNFFEVILKNIPDISWGVLPVDELLETVQMLADGNLIASNSNLLPKTKHLVELRHAMKDQQQVMLVESNCITSALKRTWDNSEYRAVQILPQWEEIRYQRPPHQLRPNIVEGKYDDWMHYYDIQFRLLREDFISPLRKGIGDYLHGKVGRDLRNVKVYRGFQIKRPLFTRAGLCYEGRFDPTPFRGYRWEHSKRLIFGSLLCLSPDHFHSTILFATVSNSDPRKLAKGFLELNFEGSADALAHIKLETEFIMVESLAYFEASRHILRSLQTAEVETMPFTKYLIGNQCRTVLHPKYLSKGNAPSAYNIQFIIKHYEKAQQGTAAIPSEFTSVAIRDNSQWPTFEMTELDKSQLKAMKMALTQEVAVIQGPPGTGKTYIGLKIVQALLANRHVWNTPNLSTFGDSNRKSLQSPILVMCFTNHALDQFLEGILDMHGRENLNLIRIGGRSKSEKIQECSLYNVRRKLRCVPRREYVKMKFLCEEAKEQGARCMSDYKAYEDLRHFIAFNEIKCVIEDDLFWSLIEPAETAEEEQLALELWLGLYVREVQEEYAPIPAQNEDGSEETGSNEDSRSEDDSSSEAMMEGVEETIDIAGNASIEKDKRMIDGLTEMFEEMKFESSDLSLTKQRGAQILYNVRRTFKIVKNEDAFWVKKSIMRKSPMHEKDVEKIENVHALELEDRYRLYRYWHCKYKAHLMSELEASCKLFNEKCAVANQARQKADRYPLEKADVIGMTTTGAAKYQHILHLVKPRIVIVEEAAEVLESHIVSALNAGTQHLILIGDHKQLRPNPNEYDLVVKYHLDISLFERLVTNNFPHVTLQIQHRMRTEIANLVRGHIYDVLDDHESVQSYPKVKGVSSNLFLIQHYQPERANDLSRSNEHEAAYLASLCYFLLQQGYSPSQITILVTYSGQLLLMKRFMPKANFEGIRVTTVDSFQGEENDIILLSLVRSNEHGVIGFLRAENRVCVALSRAKHGFYCIGNFEMLRKNSETWQSIVSDMESKGKVGESLSIHCNNHPQFHERAKFPGDFAKYFPTGGCHLPCEYLLKCGHVCALTCHSSDPEHVSYTCRKRVSETCPEGHTIIKLCYEESRCTEVVERIVPKCGHLQQMFCHEDPHKYFCQILCVRTIPVCGHSQEMMCSEDPDRVLCQSRCEGLCPNGHACPLLCYQGCRPCKVRSKIQLPLCGHTQVKYCHQEIADMKCNIPCTKTCKSGHPCQLKCYQDCTPCGVLVSKTFACGHTADVRCSEESLAKCNKPCPRKLSCDHKCPLTCGEPCDGAVCLEGIEITLQRCKHKAKIPCHRKKDHLYKRRLMCTNPCEKKLSCGHYCTGICGAPCIQKCEVDDIRRTCQQGHQLLRKCFETLDRYPCVRACKKRLSCGHLCQNPCSKSCTTESECKFLTIKKYPCGHQHRVSCSTPIEEYPCDIICRALLACGHTCRGKCSECSSTRIHRPCNYFVTQPHFCGERIRMRCAGLRDSQGGEEAVAESKLKVLTCMHSKMPYECEKVVYKCRQPCQWSCPHYKCTKPCHELCDREPCDRKCPLFLRCEHQCVGLCGEPCIEVCPECDQESFCTLAGKFSAEQTYTQLPCGHIFTVQEMDTYVGQRPSCEIGPLQCPECSFLLSCSYRYGNPVKKALFHVEAVKAKVQVLTAKSSMSADDKDRLSRVIRHSSSNFSETKLQGSFNAYSEPMRCLHNFKQKLTRPQEVISKEAGFIVFMLSKVFAFASSISESTSIASYQQIMRHLVSMAEQSHQLSFQVIQDLLSESYRLCYQAKLLKCCQKRLLRSSMTLIEKGQVFLSDHDRPSCRMSKKDFISHSRMLDNLSRHRSMFESTDEFIKDVEYFRPSIFSGCWQKCVRDHYYCIPVCKAGRVNMKCPECTGSYAVSMHSVKTPGTVKVDITEQLSEIVGTMKSAATRKKMHHQEPGEAAKDLAKRGRKGMH